MGSENIRLVSLLFFGLNSLLGFNDIEGTSNNSFNTHTHSNNMPPTETIADAMEVEELTNLALVDSVTAATDDDDDFGNLAELMDDASTKPAADQIPLLQQILADTEHYSSKAMTLKERAIYDLTKAFWKTQQYKAVVP